MIMSWTRFEVSIENSGEQSSVSGEGVDTLASGRAGLNN